MRNTLYGLASMVLVVTVGAAFVYNVQAAMIETIAQFMGYFQSLI